MMDCNLTFIEINGNYIPYLIYLISLFIYLFLRKDMENDERK